MFYKQFPTFSCYNVWIKGSLYGPIGSSVETRKPLIKLTSIKFTKLGTANGHYV